jgi:hypothetical protein
MVNLSGFCFHEDQLAHLRNNAVHDFEVYFHTYLTIEGRELKPSPSGAPSYEGIHYCIFGASLHAVKLTHEPLGAAPGDLLIE